MNDQESLATRTIGDPMLSVPAMTEVLDAICAIADGGTTVTQSTVLPAVTQSTVLDLIVDELTPERMEIIQRIAALAALRDFATERTTFSEWLGSPTVRDHVPMARPLVDAMDNDPEWPRDARTFAEIYRHVSLIDVPALDEILAMMWECYRSAVLDPHGSAATIEITETYATRIAWPDGHDELDPKTEHGVSRLVAQGTADDYNRSASFSAHHRGQAVTDAVETATVVRRTAIVGPWSAV